MNRGESIIILFLFTLWTHICICPPMNIIIIMIAVYARQHCGLVCFQVSIIIIMLQPGDCLVHIISACIFWIQVIIIIIMNAWINNRAEDHQLHDDDGDMFCCSLSSSSSWLSIDARRGVAGWWWCCNHYYYYYYHYHYLLRAAVIAGSGYYYYYYYYSYVMSGVAWGMEKKLTKCGFIWVW